MVCWYKFFILATSFGDELTSPEFPLNTSWRFFMVGPWRASKPEYLMPRPDKFGARLPINNESVEWFYTNGR